MFHSWCEEMKTKQPASSVMVNHHCTYLWRMQVGQSLSTDLPTWPGTIFIPFQGNSKMAWRRMHACGRVGKSSLPFIKSPDTYICSIHFLEPVTQIFEGTHAPIIEEPVEMLVGRSYWKEKKISYHRAPPKAPPQFRQVQVGCATRDEATNSIKSGCIQLKKRWSKSDVIRINLQRSEKMQIFHGTFSWAVRRTLRFSWASEVPSDVLERGCETKHEIQLARAAVPYPTSFAPRI